MIVLQNSSCVYAAFQNMQFAHRANYTTRIVCAVVIIISSQMSLYHIDVLLHRGHQVVHPVFVLGGPSKTIGEFWYNCPSIT